MITLIGKSLHGKNRIAQWGNQWEILLETGGRLKLVSCLDKSTKVCKDSTRWVRRHNDPDFIIGEDNVV